MADLSSILGGMVQGFKDFGTGLVDFFGTGAANIGDIASSIATGRATTKNQDDFRKWLYQTDDKQDAAAKGLGTILNGVSTVADVMPGAQAVTANPLFNGLQGAIGGVSDELKMAGKDADWGRAAQRAGVGAASGLASAYAGQGLAKTGNKLLSNGLTRGAVSGALGGGIANAGYTGIEGGSVQDMINAGLYGAQTGALVGGTTGLARELIKPNHKMDAMGAAERQARIENAQAQIDDIGPISRFATDEDSIAKRARIAELNDAIKAYQNGYESYNDYKTALETKNTAKQTRKTPKTVADLMLSPEQEEYFKNSQVRDASGNLKKLYHGSPNGEFDTFSREYADAEGDWGKGFYFTDNEADVKRNYYDGGPDFDNKIARRAEQLEAELDIPYEQAEKQARNELYKGAYQIDAYTNMENPATVGKTVLLDGSEYPVKNLSDYDGDVEGYYQDLIYDLTDDVLADTDTDYRYHDDLMRTLYDAYAEGGVEPQRLKEMLNELEITDDNGKLVGNEIARSVIQNLGYDGIIDPTVANKFTNMGLDPNTTHYIAFEPNQIKSIKNKKPTSADSIMASKNIGGSSGSAEAEGAATRVGSKNVAQVDLNTLPESMKAAKSYLNKDYIKDIESYSGKKIGDMTDAELMEYALKDKPAETRDIYRVGIEDIVKGGKTMRQVAENYAANRYLRELADKNFDDIDSKALVSYLLNNAHRLNDSKTRAADIELSDRLGIGQSNTFMDDYRVPYDAQGVFDVADSTISIRPELSQESAVNTIAHERLHSFQTENDIKRYDKRVLNAYNDLAKELKPLLKTPEETAKRYRFDADYWGNEREQQSRMLQQYLENKGYTKGGLQEANVGEWGNEINPAFDKFFDKLRALSKKGVALPALTALFGGGAIMAATQGDDKKKKSEVK